MTDTFSDETRHSLNKFEHTHNRMRFLSFGSVWNTTHVKGMLRVNNVLFFSSPPQLISLVMVSIGVYARITKHAGKTPPSIKLEVLGALRCHRGDLIGLCFALDVLVVAFISVLAPELQANRKSFIKILDFTVAALSTIFLLLYLKLFCVFPLPPSHHPCRDGSGMSGSGSRNAVVDRRGPHVLSHLLWLCGLPAGKHLPAADSK